MESGTGIMSIEIFKIMADEDEMKPAGFTVPEFHPLHNDPDYYAIGCIIVLDAILIFTDTALKGHEKDL